MSKRLIVPSGTAAHLTVRPKARTQSPPLGYRQLLQDAGPNKHDQAIVLITACIGDGVKTRKAIIDIGNRNGLNPGHVAIMLTRDTGGNPDLHRWRLDEDGTYTLLN